MKKLLPLLFLFPLLAVGQTYTEQSTGSINYHTQYKGGIGADKTLKIPVTDVSSIPGFTMKGLIKVNATGGYLEYHDGTSWLRLVDVALANSAYKPINYTPSAAEILTALGYNPISVESDPIWNTDKANYYNKTNSDLRYLQSYIETDPLVPAFAKSLTAFGVIKALTDALYEPIISKNNAFNKNFGNASGTVAEGNDSRIVNAVPNTRTINGHSLSGDISVSKSDIGLGSADNTSDSSKPISTSTQSALDLKLSIALAAATYQPLLGYVPVPNTRTINGYALTSNINLTKADISLGNINNTSDADKPVSTATQTALNDKVDKVTGKQLSTEDYTTSEKSKLSGIQSGAEVNVNADWNAVSGDALIMNKPTFTNYTAGTGINITGNTISNSAPDQTVSLTAGNGISITGTYPNFTITLKQPTVNTVTRSIVSTAAAANGFQISSTAFSIATYSVTINTSVSLSGNASGYVVLEVCPTNSATAGDWIERGRTTSGQSGTLVIGLTLNQAGGASATIPIPIGYYARLRSVNVAGTPTYAYNTGVEIIYN